MPAVAAKQQSQNRTQGRYSDVDSARFPPNGLATANSRQAVHITTGAVQDPLDPSGKSRIVVSINRRVDLLEEERAANARDEDLGISEGAYRTGRQIQRLFEKGARVGSSSNWSGGDRVNAADVHEEAIGYGIMDAAERNRMAAAIVKEVGQIGFRRLRALLAEGKTYLQVAEDRGRGGDRGRRWVAESFRSDLEALADAWSATGQRAKKG